MAGFYCPLDRRKLYYAEREGDKLTCSEGHLWQWVRGLSGGHQFHQFIDASKLLTNPTSTEVK